MKKIIYFSLILLINQTVYAQSWSTIPGMNAQVYALYADTTKNLLYAGGNLTMAGGVPSNYVTKWNGTKWDSLGKGVSNTVYAITKYKNEIYVGGTSTVKWNDTIWTPLLNTYQNAFCEYNGNLYAGAGDIVRWNGTKWDTITTTQVWVGTFAVYKNELYVGGVFSSINGVSANNIAKWDGTKWSAVGTGVDGAIWTLVVNNGELYAGGDFTTAGGTSTNRVAKWDGIKWSTVGSGMDGRINSLVVYNNNLYAGGNFKYADGTSANNIAKWDGIKWSALGTGTNDIIRVLVVFNNKLYVGGYFTMAGGKIANYIAIWDEAVGIKETAVENIFTVYPNPAKDKTIIEYTLPQGSSKAELVVYNLQGQELKRVAVSSGSGKVEFNSEELQAGTYFIKVQSEKGSEMRKVVVVK